MDFGVDGGSGSLFGVGRYIHRQYIQKDSVLTIELTLMRDVEIQFVETNPKQ